MSLLNFSKSILDDNVIEDLILGGNEISFSQVIKLDTTLSDPQMIIDYTKIENLILSSNSNIVLQPIDTINIDWQAPRFAEIKERTYVGGVIINPSKVLYSKDMEEVSVITDMLITCFGYACKSEISTAFSFLQGAMKLIALFNQELYVPISIDKIQSDRITPYEL